MADERKTEVRRNGTVVRSGGRREGRGGAMLGVVVLLMMAAGLACLLAVVMLSGCTAQAVVDESSPRCSGASVFAGSDLTESSQYAEVRLAFDAPLEASGNVADDLQVTLNGEAVDAETIAVEASVDGSDVVVRLVPTASADGKQASVYYALYDGLVQVAAKADDGGLAHVKAAGGSSNAVLDEPVTATVSTGIQVAVQAQTAGSAAAGTPASVTFAVRQFAQLRCCSWFYFGEGLPIVMTHNHEFARDLPETCAQRIADTVNANYSEWLSATCDGATITVTAAEVVDGQEMGCQLVEGVGANPAAGLLEGGVESGAASSEGARASMEGVALSGAAS